MRTYGITEADVAAMLAAQHGVCAICQAADAAHIDHDHTTGAVRGMLCFRCNAALGQLDD
ncbi:MAG TPA: endonuclease VII domain-containing protein, partial [Actinomycetes bacterium]|nr:endonuclease VII domain-containing protein [Actinomycetes bacterium]